MTRRFLWSSLGLFLILCLLPLLMLLAAFRSCAAEDNAAAAPADLPQRIRDHEAELTAVVTALRTRGEADAERNALRKVWREVMTATVDANGNVYFITDSNTFANAGFVCRQGEAELLGDGVEPAVRHAEHLFGPWWRYRAS